MTVNTLVDAVVDAVANAAVDAVAIACDRGAAAIPSPIPQTFALKRLQCL